MARRPPSGGVCGRLRQRSHSNGVNAKMRASGSPCVAQGKRPTRSSGPPVPVRLRSRATRRHSELHVRRSPVSSPREEAGPGRPGPQCGFDSRHAGFHLAAAFVQARIDCTSCRRGTLVSLWPQFVAHVATVTAGIAAASLALRSSSDAVLRLVAGLVAIFGRDKRSRADRALEVIRVIRGRREARHDGSTARDPTGRSLRDR